MKPAIPFLLSAAALLGQTADVPEVTKYRLFDVGTLGGSYSGFYDYDETGGDFTPRALNAEGQLAGASLVNSVTAGSFLWSRGKLYTLPSLPHATALGGGSNALGLNDSGLAVGISNNGDVAPSNGVLYSHAVSWTGGKLQYLGDFGGHDSWANYVTNTGLIAGFAFNAIPDAYSFYGTQYHAATWVNGKIRDLGTLGGTDSEAWAANDAGQVIGIAAVGNTPVPPFGIPQTDAFLWSNGAMQDLGNLGGGFSTPSAINASGDVTVISFDATNQLIQSYLWTEGNKTLLHSVGGSFLEAVALNDQRVSVGAGTDPTDTNFLAAAWLPDGTGKLLGAIGSDTGSIALGINRHGAVVGGSGSVTLTAAATYSRAFIWRNGKLVDLNALIPAGSSLTLNVAYTINDAGVIAGMGTTAAGDTHAFILAPESTSAEEYPAAADAPAAPGSFVRGSKLLTPRSREMR